MTFQATDPGAAILVLALIWLFLFSVVRVAVRPIAAVPLRAQWVATSVRAESGTIVTLRNVGPATAYWMEAGRSVANEGAPPSFTVSAVAVAVAPGQEVSFPLPEVLAEEWIGARVALIEVRWRKRGERGRHEALARVPVPIPSEA